MTGSHWFPTGSRNHWIRLVPRFPPLQGTGTGTSQDQPGTIHWFQYPRNQSTPMVDVLQWQVQRSRHLGAKTDVRWLRDGCAPENRQ